MEEALKTDREGKERLEQEDDRINRWMEDQYMRHEEENEGDKEDEGEGETPPRKVEDEALARQDGGFC